MNKNILFIFLIVVSILFTSSLAFAIPIASQTMTLLAVNEGGPANESTGATASVTLEIIPGTGRIFINTYPFSKVDTQVSVRLANEVACHFLATDCSAYDFIYSIKTGSSTIGGPSAGAAISALTVASLDGEYINQNTTISGTINSGGVVGAVGGLKEKIAAAADLGVATVLIPLGERYIADKESALDEDTVFNETQISSQINDSQQVDISQESEQNIAQDTNQTSQDNETLDSRISLPLKTDLVAYGAQKGVFVVETGTLDEVLSYMTNKQYVLPKVTVEPPLFYTVQMKRVAEELCGRAQELLDTLSVNVSYGNLTIHVDKDIVFPPGQTVILEKSNIDLVTTLTSAKQLLNTSKGAFAATSYYSAASYCYGAALNLRFISLLNETPQSALALALDAVNNTDINLSQYRTLTDLQTYMLVDERLTEASERINDGRKFMDKDLRIFAINSFATAIERVSSAKLWSAFFSTPEDEIVLDLTQVEESCKLKIQEATERQSLIGYYIDDDDIGAELLASAKKELGKNPILCLFAASKAKASYDVVLSSLGLTGDVFNATFEKKTQIAARVISEQFNRGAFPIIGYSYYEYARSLGSDDQGAALLYIQYALELSNLDAYLPQTALTSNREASTSWLHGYKSLSLSAGEALLLGLALGTLLGVTLLKVEQAIRNRSRSKVSVRNVRIVKSKKKK